MVGKLSTNEGNKLPNQYYSFVVRVWLESADRDVRQIPIWRGSIEHVGSGSRIFFSDLQEISRFIEKQIGVETGPVHLDFQQLLKSTQETFKNYWTSLIHKLFKR